VNFCVYNSELFSPRFQFRTAVGIFCVDKCVPCSSCDSKWWCLKVEEC